MLETLKKLFKNENKKNYNETDKLYKINKLKHLEYLLETKWFVEAVKYVKRNKTYFLEIEKNKKEFLQILCNFYKNDYKKFKHIYKENNLTEKEHIRQSIIAFLTWIVFTKEF